MEYSTPVVRGFALTTYKEDIEFYKSLGATSQDILCQIWGNGKSWIGHFYVSKDRQTIWTAVNPDRPLVIMPDGSKKKPARTPWVFQVYRRMPDGTY